MSLDPTRPLTEIAASFARQLETALGIECLAILRWSDELPDVGQSASGRQPVLYLSPSLTELGGGPAFTGAGPVLAPAAFAAVRSGRPEYLDLGTRVRSRDEESLLQCGVRYMARIPISTAGRVSGFVSVRFEQERDPEQGFEELEDAVRPLALVIEHSELLSRLDEQRRTLATTADILRTMATSRESGDAGDAIALALQHFFDADAVVVGAAETEGEAMVLLGSSRVSALESADLHMLLGSVVEAQDGGEARAADAAGFRSVISAPFSLATAAGGLAIVASRQADCWGRRSSAQLIDLCGAVGLAIDRLRLIAATEATTRTLGAQTRVLAALGPGATIGGVAEVFVAEARKLFGATHALVATLTAGEAIVALSSDHMVASQLRFERPPDAAELAPYAGLLRGEPQLIDDLGAIGRGSIEEATFASGIRALMRAPIRNSRGAVSGLITLGHPTARAVGRTGRGLAR